MNTSAYTGRAASSLRVSNQCETGTAGHEAEGIAYLEKQKNNYYLLQSKDHKSREWTCYCEIVFTLKKFATVNYRNNCCMQLRYMTSV